MEKKNRVRAVIFDCDGTLLDTERIYMSTWNPVAASFGYQIPNKVLLDTRGKSAEIGREIYMKAMGKDFPIDEINKKRRLMNEEIFFSKSKEELIKPGVEDVLSWLKKQGIKTAIASAKTYQMTSEHLKHVGLFELADVVLGKDMVEHNKPEPDLFLKAAEWLSVKPKDCLVVGDTKSDVLGAQAAGMKMAFVCDLVAVDDEIKEKATFILSQIDELKTILN